MIGTGRRRAEAGPGPDPAAAPREVWSLEVQVHPSDIRKRVRYLFLSRLEVTLASLAILAYLLLVALALALAPDVAGSLFGGREYRTLAMERARQGERLQGLIGRLGEIEERGAELAARLDKMRLAYGLPPDGGAEGGRAAPAAARLPGSIYAGAVEQGERTRAGVESRLRAIDAALAGLREFEARHPEEVRATPSTCPLRGEFVLTSPFGNRRSPFTKEFQLHAGIDLAAPAGTPVVAPADGVVAFAGRYPLGRSAAWWRLGNLVMVRHGERFVTVFGHCAEIAVAAGRRVRQGDLLATVGNTGWSLNPHLHYEVRRRDGTGEPLPVDPRLYILDQRWRDEERLLVRAQAFAPPAGFEPLPPGVAGGRSR